jgi:hypothetical protein
MPGPVNDADLDRLARALAACLASAWRRREAELSGTEDVADDPQSVNAA